MRDALWVAGLLLVPLFGMWIARIEFVQRLDVAARIAIQFAAGIVTLTALMFAMTVIGVSWNRTSLGIPLLIIVAFGVRRHRRRLESGSSAAALQTAPIILFVLYAVLTARMTCADLLFFWGPKGQVFYLVGGIDPFFLGWSNHYLMHSDYPPLVPLLYAFASVVAHRFSWWGALAGGAVFYAATLAAFHGLSGKGRFTVLFAAVMALGYSVGMVAGGADPVLLFFECIALCALTFAPDDRGAQIVAAIALAGVAATKVEGALFCAILIGGYVIVQRKVLPALLQCIPPFLLLGGWLLYARNHQLLDQYTRAREPLVGNVGKTLLTTLQVASYQSLYIPWLAALAPLTLGRRWRRAALPLLAGVASLASFVVIYLHSNVDPTFWIRSSAERVLLTPLMCFAVASAAASE